MKRFRISRALILLAPLAACAGEVTPPARAVATVTVTPPAGTIVVPGSLQLAATVKDSSGAVLKGRPVAFTSSDSTQATVSGSGLVTALAPGDVIITATSESAAGIAAISLLGPVAAVLVLPANPTLVIGDSLQLTAVPVDAAGHPRVDRPVGGWASDGYRAVVSASGRVQAAAAGAASISALSDNGTGSTTITNVLDTGIASLSATAGRTCATSWNRVLYCWGTVTFAIPGINPPGVASVVRTAARLPGSFDGLVVETGPEHSCFRTQAGAAWCWGSNANGKLGNPSVTTICPAGNPCTTVPVQVTGGLTFTQLSVGRSGTCGIVTGGAAWCWGRGTEGQLGNGGTADSPVPVAVSGGHAFRIIRQLGNHTCGIRTDTVAMCWGANIEGQLGIGSSDNVPHPVPAAVSGGVKFLFVGVGAAHSCAQDVTGRLYCWGSNAANQLGLAATTETCAGGACSTTPAAVTAASYRLLAVGEGGSCVLTFGQQRALCWGPGFSGPGTVGPQAVPGTLGFEYITVGTGHACGHALSNLVVWCWGSNSEGQLGTGLLQNESAPARVVGQR